MNNFLKKRLRKFMLGDSLLARTAGRAGFVLYAYRHNYNFDFDSNGEKAVIEALAPFRLDTVMDVGANVGNYTRLVHKLAAPRLIVCFEPAGPIFDRLVQNVGDLSGVRAERLGLAAKASVETIWLDDATCGHTTLVPSANVERKRPVEVVLTTGDLYCEQHRIDRIDLLKIDTEGFDPMVIHGFERMLARGAIRAIQFEFTPLGVVYPCSLQDIWKLLEAVGYKVGKIYPDGVAFAPFRSQPDWIFGPNYLAVRATDSEFLGAVISRSRSDQAYVGPSISRALNAITGGAKGR